MTAATQAAPDCCAMRCGCHSRQRQAVRSFARLAVTPRNYQLVPLMMAAHQDVTRLLIADGVGIGKTVEAGLIAAELLATGETQRLAVLCSPQLAPQWQSELRHKFGIDAQLLLPSTVNRLMRSVPFGSNVYQHHPTW